MRASIAIGLLAATASSGTPLSHPKRLIGQEPVDLTPLFQWWAKHQGERPLKSWSHITGTVVGTNSLGWIVNTGSAAGAIHEDSRHGHGASNGGKVVLRNPPVEERAEFDALTARSKALKVERAKAAAEESGAKTRGEAVAKERKGYSRLSPAARKLAAESRQLQQIQTQAKQRVSELDRQLQPVNTRLKLYPSTERYEVDCFALGTAETSQGLRVYDYGLVIK